MKKYTDPKIEILTLKSVDVIATSGGLYSKDVDSDGIFGNEISIDSFLDI